MEKNFARILFCYCCVLVRLSRCDDCESQVVYTVNITGGNDEKFQTRMLSDESDLGVVIIDRPVRRMNSNMIFRAPQCKREQVAQLMRHYDVDKYRVEQAMTQEGRRMQFDFTGADHDEFRVGVNDFDFDVIEKRYLTSHEIDAYMDYVAMAIQAVNGNIRVKLMVEGHSYEKRPIKSLTVQYGDDKKSNPIVFIDAGIHAREWHSRSLALFAMRQLIREAELDRKGIIYTTTFIIVANANPDGYEYSLSVDNMWRKTRRPVSAQCVGVDGNRNFDAQWRKGSKEKIACTEVYRGERPFSEAETRTVRNIMRRIRGQCFLYITIHTFGNSILYPYGYTTNSHPRRKLLHQVAAAGVEAVERKTGTKFVADQSGSNLYVAAGGSDDYAIDSMTIPFTYTLELGAERYGFALPTNKITEAIEEGWTAIRAMVIEAQRLYEQEIR